LRRQLFDPKGSLTAGFCEAKYRVRDAPHSVFHLLFGKIKLLTRTGRYAAYCCRVFYNAVPHYGCGSFIVLV
jgi:hypothetical protein